MIIRVLLRVAPRRARTRLRSHRPRAAASDRAPSLPSRTKLQLSLTLTLLLAFLMRPVSSLFLCSFARPVAETRCPLFPFLMKATNLLPVLLAGRPTSLFAWAMPIWDMLPRLALKCSWVIKRWHRPRVSPSFRISTCRRCARG
jgi:hypothetical protein